MHVNVMRVKPNKPASGARIQLMHTLDQMLPVDIFTNLNLFFRASFSGPATLEDFASSLIVALNRYPVVAGSIIASADSKADKLKTLVDDGRGTDILWERSPKAYADLPSGDSVDLVARSVFGNGDHDATLLMIKFTKFTCGAICMSISVSHSLADCTSTVELVKEWARISRGGSDAEESGGPTVDSWERHPQKFFPAIDSKSIAVPPGMFLPTGLVSPEVMPAPVVQINFIFSTESLRLLKNATSPSEPGTWVSTGDSVSALLWRSLSRARIQTIKPNADVSLSLAIDARSRSSDPRARSYFGNLVFPAAITISQTELFDASLAAVALSIRRMLEDQLTESSVANTIAFLESVDDVPFSNDCKLGGTWLSSWTKYPIAGEEMDFGGGPPFHVTNGVEPMLAGQIYLIPCVEGQRAIVAIEPVYAQKLQEDGELLLFAKFVG